MSESSNRGPSAYRDAGVDIDAKYAAVKSAGAAIRASYTAGVVGDLGLFGGLFDLEAVGAAGQLLVASTDGVGTKVKVATQAGRVAGIGADLVNHCVDDILVQGARPLFFLDYIAVDRMQPERVGAVIHGLADACRANGCALLGGETAEMPGVYQADEMDVAGTIVGAVPREHLLDGTRIRAGDVAIALASSGLHTNGYSLARRVLLAGGPAALDERPDELGGASLADALLAVHRSYLTPVAPLLDAGLIHGMAHVTGGGLPDNLPRVLPADCAVRLDRAAVPRPPIFDLIVRRGAISDDEAYRVFNMGFGMVLFVAAADVERTLELLREHDEVGYVAGEVVRGAREVSW